MTSKTTMNFLTASLGEFMTVWRMGGTSSLHLTTSQGHVDMGFNIRLGHPDSPFRSTSPPPYLSPYHPRRPRNRGSAQKDRDRLRAGRHQAAQSGPPSASLTRSTEPVAPTDSVPNQSTKTQEVTPGVTFTSVSAPSVSTFKCDHCEL